jgi:23S rRNA pseudouridine2605 synthase
VSAERLQKILARAGIASRRKAEELIRSGVVTVNGRVAALGDKVDPGHDSIKVDGRRVQLSTEHRYLLLNKPRGVMSTLADPEGRPTVIDFVPPGLRRALVTVGRLDFNTEGLLLLTDDGEFAQRVSHPSGGCLKTYEVKVKGRPAEGEIERLRAGIPLAGKRTLPCRITAKGGGALPSRRRRAAAPAEGEGDNSWWVVELTEGRTRQIREMFFRIGHPVQKLRRVAIGPLRAPDLPVGALRELTPEEVERLSRATERGVSRPEKPARPATAHKPAAGRAREAATRRPARKKKPAGPKKRTPIVAHGPAQGSPRPAKGKPGPRARRGAKRGRG